MAAPSMAPAAAPSAAPAPSAPASPPSTSAATSEAPASEARSSSDRARGERGRFVPSRGQTPAKQRILRESLGDTMREMPAKPDDAAVVETKPGEEAPKQADADESKAPEAQKPETPATVTDDPKSWPEPARKAHGELTAKVGQYEAELSKWHEAGPRAVQQNVRLHEENKLLRGLLEQNQVPIDQRDLDLINYRVGEQTSQKMAEAQRMRDEQSQQQQQQIAQARAQDEARSFVEDMRAQAKTAGVAFEEVAQFAAADLAMKRPVDVAAAIKRVKDLQLLQQRQVNAASPSPVKQSIPAGTQMPKDRSYAGKLARLQSSGFDV